MHIVLLPGSIRKDSFNRNLAEAISRVSIDGITMSVIDIKDIPLFNEDVESEGVPESVKVAAGEISRADGIIIVTPEYSGYPSGILVNTLNWLSRKSVEEPLINKFVATMGASPSKDGTIRAQNAIRGLLNNLSMILVPVKQLRVGSAHEKIGNDADFLDKGVADEAKAVIETFTEWINKFNK